MPLPEELTPCPECGGTRVAQKLRGAFPVPAHPSIREYFRSHNIDCLVCTRCGLVMLYAERPPADREGNEEEGTGN